MAFANGTDKDDGTTRDSPGGASGRGDTGGGHESVGSTARADRNAREGRGGQTPTGSRDPAMGRDDTGNSSRTPVSRINQSAVQGRGGQVPTGSSDPAMGRNTGGGTRARTAAERARATIAPVEDYNLAGSLSRKAQAGTMSPMEYEMARGLVAGAQSQLAANTLSPVTGAIGSGLASAIGVPEASSVASNAAKAGLLSMAAPSQPHADYGAAYAQNELSPTAVQTGINVAGAVTGPAGQALAKMTNFGIDAYRSQPYADLAQSIGMQTATGGVGDGAGSQPGQPAQTVQQAPVQQTATQPQSFFERADIDPARYSRGLLSLTS